MEELKTILESIIRQVLRKTDKLPEPSTPDSAITLYIPVNFDREFISITEYFDNKIAMSVSCCLAGSQGDIVNYISDLKSNPSGIKPMNYQILKRYFILSWNDDGGMALQLFDGAQQEIKRLKPAELLRMIENEFLLARD